MGLKKGDLIKFKHSGRYATVMRDEDTHRFMEAEDYDMLDAGLGHLAGVYGSAIDICYTDTLEIRRARRVNHRAFELVSKQEP